jgi:tetraacyldisaccharide 4'-kinase
MNLPPPVRILLWPLSLAYGAVVRLRAWLYARGWLKQKRLHATVISVGNLTVGGTGKTPMVLWLAEKFLAEGKRVAILSRGYRGSGGTSDEVELMKSRLHGRVAFGVGKNRFAEGRRLEAQGIDIFLLDDGFQHLQLARDLDILLMDASRPIGGEALLPAGRLREPLSALSRANLLVFTRVETAPGAAEVIERLHKYPVFSAATRLLGFRLLSSDATLLAPGGIGPGPFYAFCGIGNPEAFFRDLQSWHVPVAGKMAFPDHHRYVARDVLRLAQAAEKNGAKALITTEKDAQNLGAAKFDGLPVYVSVIDLGITPESEFRAAIGEMLEARRGAAA